MTDPAWAKGHDLDQLRKLAAIFKDQFKAHIHGAFGLPKEAEIAAAMDDDAAIWTDGAVALFRLMKSPSTHRSFDGKELAIRKGDIYIRAIAGSADGRRKILDKLMGECDAIFLEDFVESDAAGLWDDIGLDRTITKIAASSDIKGIWHLGDDDGRLPSFIAPADIPSVSILDPEFINASEQELIGGEIAAYAADQDQAWAQHYSNYNKRQSWTAFALRGYCPTDPQFIIKPAEMNKGWKAENAAKLEWECDDTIAAPLFPRTMEIIGRLPCDIQRIRMMRLGANGGELTRHADIVDPEAGTADRCTARLHIPISTHPDCKFSTWNIHGKRIDQHFAARSLCYLDTRKPHAVINPAKADRIHIVIDAYSNDELRGMIAGGFSA